MACEHDITERSTTAEVDGLCPLCLQAEVERLKDRLKKKNKKIRKMQELLNTLAT